MSQKDVQWSARPVLTAKMLATVMGCSNSCWLVSVDRIWSCCNTFAGQAATWPAITLLNTRWGARNCRAERANHDSPTHEPELGNSSGGTAAQQLPTEPPVTPLAVFCFGSTAWRTLEMAETSTTAAKPAQRLRVEAVTVGYAPGKRSEMVAARDISLGVDAGEFAAIIGPSGCGKSTLLNSIAGLIEPSAGQILIDGDPSAPRLGHVAYMQQRDLLLPWRTVLENARMALEISGTPRQQADAAASELAERFGLNNVLGRYPWQLSGGMRQRAALLRSSLQHSGILLLDEPFGALDALTRRDLQQWLVSVLDRRDRAILLVTHDVEEALLLADRVYVMSPGPGTIASTVEVSLPRPRGAEVVTSPEFVALKATVLRELSAATRSPSFAGDAS